jgi:prepilin peptidase CpaA
MILDMARLLVFPALVAFAAASDLLTMTISNRISLVLVAGYFVLALAGGASGAEIMAHSAAGLSVLAIAFGFFAMGWIGGGDAKLAAATALWFGFGDLLNYVLYASIFGGALTLLLIQFRLWPLPGILSAQPWLQRLHERNGGIPYGIALAAAALVVYPNTAWIKAIDFSRLAIG